MLCLGQRGHNHTCPGAHLRIDHIRDYPPPLTPEVTQGAKEPQESRELRDPREPKGLREGEPIREGELIRRAKGQLWLLHTASDVSCGYYTGDQREITGDHL